MLDSDVVALYEVPTKALNQAVKRNSKRFPNDFMFRLTLTEWKDMRSQIVTTHEHDAQLNQVYDAMENLLDERAAQKPGKTERE